MTYTDLYLRATRILHALALGILGTLAFTAAGLTAMSAFGALPWLDLSLRLGEVTYPTAGPVVQVVLTAILVSLLFFVPANLRVLQLERSHRDFQVSMNDVARAYHLCHSADRAGVFTLSSEFDAVRERMAYLRDHPDLPGLEPEVMTLAAQMGQQARHLADVYSDAKVARARDFLRQRQHEAEHQQERILEAQHIVQEIRRWSNQVGAEEAVVAAQLARLDEQLQGVLPALGYDFEDPVPDALPTDSNVVPLKVPATEQAVP